MNIALIGASGFVGSALLKETLARAHTVTALVSRPERLASQPGLTARAVDATDSAALAECLRGHDAVISAFSGHAQPEVFNYYLRGMRAIIAAVKAAAVPRLLVVGGAASLEVAPGKLLLDSPDFPEQWRETAAGAVEALKLLRAETTLDWTFLSPSAMLAPGTRTGTFRLGGDQLLVDAAGNSHISVEDYAVAMVNELEQPAHSRQRFTVGY